MPPHSNKTSRLPIETRKTPSVLDGQRNTRQNSNSSRYLSNPSLGHPQQGPTTVDDTGGDLVSHGSSNNMEKGGGGGDGDGEADGKNENNKDGDVTAPSGSAIQGDENQAGHISEMKAEQSLTTEKYRKRNPSPINISDNDDYNGVDLITDSEGRTVEQVEEEMIINSEDGLTSSRQPLPEISSDGGGDDKELFSDLAYFEQCYDGNETAPLADEMKTFDPPFFEKNTPMIPAPSRRKACFSVPRKPLRKVANRDPSYSEEDVGSSPFVPKDKLPSSFRCTLDKKKYSGKRLKKKSDETQGVLHNDEQSVAGAQISANRNDEQSVVRFQISDDSSDHSCGSTSGYESDLGESTEEEAVPPSRPQALLRRASISTMNDGIQTPTPSQQQSQPTKSVIQAPTLLNWLPGPARQITILTPSREILSIQDTQQPDNTNTQMLASNSRSSTVHASPRASLPRVATIPYNNNHVWSSEVLELKFGPRPPLMVQTELLSQDGHFPSAFGQAWGSPEPSNGGGSDDGVYEDSAGYDDGEVGLDIGQFVDFGDESEEDEAEKGDFPEFAVEPQATSSDDTAGGSLLGTAALGDHNLIPAPLYESQDALVEQSSRVFQDGRNTDAVGPPSPLRKRRRSNEFDEGEVALKRRTLNPC